MTDRRLYLGLLGALFALGCGDGSSAGAGDDGGGGTGGAGPIDGLEAIVVTSGQLEIVVDGSAADEVPYTATGTFDDGSTRVSLLKTLSVASSWPPCPRRRPCAA